VRSRGGGAREKPRSEKDGCRVKERGDSEGAEKVGDVEGRKKGGG